MNLKYLAHAAFLFTSDKGTRVLIDPYEPGGFEGAINYKPIDENVDAIIISHDHADHNYIAPHHAEAKVFNKPGRANFNDVEILGIKTFHDTSKGGERGENLVFVIKIDDIVICHLGDLGHVLAKEELEAIGRIDVLLIPVGGLYTIDANAATSIMQAVMPKICIPMHYKTEKLSFGFAPVDNFLKNKNNVKQKGVSEIELDKNNLPQVPEIWALNPDKI